MFLKALRTDTQRRRTLPGGRLLFVAMCTIIQITASSSPILIPTRRRCKNRSTRKPHVGDTRSEGESCFFLIGLIRCRGASSLTPQHSHIFRLWICSNEEDRNFWLWDFPYLTFAVTWCWRRLGLLLRFVLTPIVVTSIERERDRYESKMET